MIKLCEIMDKREDSRQRAVRRIAAAVSLLLHGVFLFWLFHARYTIDTHPFGFEVRHVYLAPANPLFYRNEDIARKKMSSSAMNPDSAVIPTATPPLDSREEDHLSFQSSTASPSLLSTSFRLSLPADYLSRLPEGYEFDLIRRLEPKVSEGKISGKNSSDLEFDPERYLGGGLGTPASLSSAARRPVFRPSSTVLSAVRSEILIPWAERVVEKVQMNWTLPAPQRDVLEMTVRIALEVGRGAQIQAFHVLDPSLSPELDRSALEAVRLSFPLPELPSDIPNEPFSIILVFSVHE